MKIAAFIFLLLVYIPVNAQNLLYYSNHTNLSSLNKITLPNTVSPPRSYLLKGITSGSDRPWATCTGCSDQINPPKWYNDSSWSYGYDLTVPVSDQIVYVVREEPTVPSKARIEIIDQTMQNIKTIELPDINFELVQDKKFNRIYLISNTIVDKIITIREINTLSHTIDAVYNIPMPPDSELQYTRSQQSSYTIAISSANKVIYLMDSYRKKLIELDLINRVSNTINIGSTPDELPSITNRPYFTAQIVDSELLIHSPQFIHKYDIQNKIMTRQFIHFDEDIPYQNVFFNAVNKKIIVINKGREDYATAVKVWIYDSITGQLLRQIEPNYLNGSYPIVYSLNNNTSPSGELLFIPFYGNRDNSDNNILIVFNLVSNSIVAQIKLYGYSQRQVIGFNKDGSKAYIADAGYLHIFNTQSLYMENTIYLGEAIKYHSASSHASPHNNVMMINNEHLLFRSRYFIYFLPLADLSAPDLNTIVGTLSNEKNIVGRMAGHPNKPFVYATQAYEKKYQSGIPSIYLPNYLPKNQVNVYHTSTQTLFTHFEVGNVPLGIVLNSAGTRGYVANHRDNTLSIFDASKNSVIKTVATGEGPVGVALDESAQNVYVTNEAEQTLSIFNSQTLTEIKRISLSAEPQNIVLNLNTDKAYLSTRTGETILVIDLLTQKEITSIVLYSQLFSGYNYDGDDFSPSIKNHGLTLTPDGSRLITTSEEYNVHIINTETDSIIDSIAYADIFSGQQIEGFKINQMSGHPYIAAESIEDQQIEWLLNLYRNQNLVAINYNKVPSFDVHTKLLNLHEISDDYNNFYFATLSLFMHEPVDIFSLHVAKVQNQPIIPLSESPYYENGYAYIPQLSVLKNGQISSCKLILKRLERPKEQWKFEVIGVQKTASDVSDDCDLFNSKMDYMNASQALCSALSTNNASRFSFCP